MLAKCHMSRTLTRQSPRWIAQHRRMQTSPTHLYEHHDLTDVPPADSSLSDPFLQPVPPFRHTLFDDNKPRPWFYDNLNSKTDIRDSDIHNFDDLQLAGIRTLDSYNALVSRTKKIGVPIRPETSLIGIEYAVKNPAAMREYLRLWSTSPHREHPSLHPARRKTVFYVASKLAELPTQFVRDNKILARQYSEVITGWTHLGYKSTPGEIRKPSLYHIAQGLKLDTWQNYMKLLARFSGPKGLYNEWVDYSTQLLADESSKSDCKPEPQRLTVFTYMTGPSTPQVLNAARNITIRCLVYTGAWRLAWRLAYELDDVAKDIDSRTWRFLLQYPSGVRKWIQEMNDPAIAMLESKISQLERSLGIRWTGGEDGHHVVEHGPFREPLT